MAVTKKPAGRNHSSVVKSQPKKPMVKHPPTPPKQDKEKQRQLLQNRQRFLDVTLKGYEGSYCLSYMNDGSYNVYDNKSMNRMYFMIPVPKELRDSFKAVYMELHDSKYLQASNIIFDPINLTLTINP